MIVQFVDKPEGTIFSRSDFLSKQTTGVSQENDFGEKKDFVISLT